MKLSRWIPLLTAAVCALRAFASGTLTPVGAAHAPIQIRTHQVNVTLTNGFAQTEVKQTFFNPNPHDLEAIYAFPVPRSASLSEVTIVTGERTLRGEVLPRTEAQAAYEDEKSQGKDAGLATKNSYQNFEFRVTPVRANSEVQLRIVYYQPIDIDTGVGRYVYPLEDGGTDTVAQRFWTANPKVEGEFTVNVELKSAVPVADVRVPGFESAVQTQKLGDGHYRVSLARPGTSLDRDFVFYYRLASDLPGRIEVIPYRAAADKPGTFMMVVTPGVDLQPLRQGSDYVFVLDQSGSMQGKLGTLARGVTQALGQMRPEDRFRIVTFNNRAHELVPWTAASPEAARAAAEKVAALASTGGTDLYAGIAEGLRGLDADRATSLVLVTDGVANSGIVDPAAFAQLVSRYDIRVFGFLLGNSANWPLLRLIADETGGFYAAVSNEDDIVGQLLLAKSKVTSEALHSAAFKFSGTPVRDVTGDTPRKIFRGQQLVLFGRYDTAGRATVKLHAKLTGEDKTYTATFDLPETDTDNPEIERLWALAQIEQIEQQQLRGATPESEARDAITNLGVTYQLVTDHTAMAVLSDESFTQRGIERRNLQRTTREQTAQTARATAPVRSHRVDSAQPAFSTAAPHVSHGSRGGGAIDRELLLLIVALGAFAAWRYFRRAYRELKAPPPEKTASGDSLR